MFLFNFIYLFLTVTRFHRTSTNHSADLTSIINLIDEYNNLQHYTFISIISSSVSVAACGCQLAKSVNLCYVLAVVVVGRAGFHCVNVDCSSAY